MTSLSNIIDQQTFGGDAERETVRIRQFVAFRLGEQDYAVPIEQTREVILPSEITPLPDVPTAVRGVTNLRGTIVPVIRVHRLLGLEEAGEVDEAGDAPAADAGAATAGDARTVVVFVREKLVGLEVDAVRQVVRVPEDEIQPPPPIGDAAASVTGLARFEGRLVILLDAERLLARLLGLSSGDAN